MPRASRSVHGPGELAHRGPSLAAAAPASLEERMPLKTFRLTATVSSETPDAIRAALNEVLGKNASIERTADGYRVEATVVGVEARELNRRLLSAMRRIEKSTRLRSEWTADGVAERFFDYVFLKERSRG